MGVRNQERTACSVVRSVELRGVFTGGQSEGRREAMNEAEQVAEVQMALAYRRAQRQLGEAQVALQLLAGLLKANPGVPELEQAAAGAQKAKGLLFKRVTGLEQRVFGRTA